MSNPLKELGKEYFCQLLKREHPNMKMGDELKFGIQFLDKDGNVSKTIIETIHKSELNCKEDEI